MTFKRPYDLSESRAYPYGRAAALLALEAAIEWISEGRGDRIRVAGADTYLGGGIQPIGPWPTTLVIKINRFRCFSGAKLLFQEERVVSPALVNIGSEFTSRTASLPASGLITTFSGRTFDFDRTLGLGIEAEVEHQVRFQGQGTVTFNSVTFNVPQFNISSTM